MTDTLAAVIAGGLSSRFGSPKALATIGGTRVVDRVLSVVRSVVSADAVVSIANDADIARAIGLPSRPDVIRGIGALGGVHSALVWARERHCGGVLAVGCDLPFLEPALLRALLAHTGDADIVIPESEGPRGVEPLCAWYGIACTPAVETAVAAGNTRMIGFHDRVRVRRLPLDEVRGYGDPTRMFMNLNTPADRETAERMLAREE